MLQQGSDYSADKAAQSADFFTAGVRSTIGSVVQVGLHVAQRNVDDHDLVCRG